MDDGNSKRKQAWNKAIRVYAQDEQLMYNQEGDPIAVGYFHHIDEDGDESLLSAGYVNPAIKYEVAQTLSTIYGGKGLVDQVSEELKPGFLLAVHRLFRSIRDSYDCKKDDVTVKNGTPLCFIAYVVEKDGKRGVSISGQCDDTLRMMQTLSLQFDTMQAKSEPKPKPKPEPVLKEWKDDIHTEERYEEYHNTQGYQMCRARHKDGMLCTLEKGHTGAHHAHGSARENDLERCIVGWE